MVLKMEGSYSLNFNISHCCIWGPIINWVLYYSLHTRIDSLAH
jgi:hypothetical protein